MDTKNKKYKESSSLRLENIISTKINTAFIGAISAFEEEFGYLWGHGVDPRRLSIEEKMNKELWANVRNKIFDNGNQQIRNIKKELSYYDIEWNRYNTSSEF